MSDRATIAEELVKPLDVGDIAERSQAGQNLSYIESHIAIRHANTIFGWDGWSDTIVSMTLVDGPREVKKDNGGVNIYTGYTCVVRVTVGNVTREGIGFGQGIDRDAGKSHESAVKEAESDALKRALRTFGAQFGLDLYDKQYLAGLKKGDAGYNKRNGTKPKDAEPVKEDPQSEAQSKPDAGVVLDVLRAINRHKNDAVAAAWRSDWKTALEEVGLKLNETIIAFAAIEGVARTIEKIEEYFEYRIEAAKGE